MQVIQYGAVLPANYAMEQMRERVRRNSPLLDRRRGISFKAYLLRERGKDGSPVNYYGSFYLWNDSAAMAHFLTGGGAFERIITGLGRLPVDHLTCLAAFAGTSKAAPTAALRLTTAIPPSLDIAADGMGLSHFVTEQRERLVEFARRADVHTCALALDTQRWALTFFAAGAGTLDLEGGPDRFEVLHVSQPDRDRIPAITAATESRKPAMAAGF